jgi:hypothetical protein
MSLCRTLGWSRLVGRVGVLLMLVLMMVVVVDYSRSRMVCRMMIRRWQALGWVGVMLRRASKVSDAASVTMVQDKTR